MPIRKNWDQAAGAIWSALTDAAGRRETVTYGALAPLIPTNPLSVGRALGPIQTFCLEGNYPPLTALVVGKTSGLPGNGFVAWDVDDLDEGLEAVFRYPWSTINNPFVGFSDGTTEQQLAEALLDNPDDAAEVYGRIRNRGVAQRIFRRAVLKAYDYACCLCECSFDTALEAAHITPWGECTHQERLDVRNGLLLCSTHHRMFDAAQISVTDRYKVEYCDPKGAEGTYSSADVALSIDLHGKMIKLPSQKALWPNKEALRKRLNA